MAKFHSDHAIALSAERYFQLTANLAFEQFQAARLNLATYEDVERVEIDGGVRRRIHVVPDVKFPAAVQKLIDKQLGGRRVAYEEVRTVPNEGLGYDWEIRPPAMADKLSIYGSLTIKPDGADRCRRILDSEVSVRIFGVGGVIEKFIVSELRKSYDKVPGIVAEWLAREA